MKEANPDVDEDYPFLQEVGNIVSAACLSHDLGNPAFGHSGESAISTYFTEGEGRKFQEQVTAEEWADLTHFEDDKKVTDHHALLVTDEKPSAMLKEQSNIYNMIAKRMVESFSDVWPKGYPNVIMDEEGEMIAKGTVIKQYGGDCLR
ncbi:hypothetical protein FQR65_LT15775 [Abscondita terminalis]|nr:hypothetical protein FQR65_LT15775 [Abscondita terminalis]